MCCLCCNSQHVSHMTAASARACFDAKHVHIRAQHTACVCYTSTGTAAPSNCARLPHKHVHGRAQQLRASATQAQTRPRPATARVCHTSTCTAAPSNCARLPHKHVHGRAQQLRASATQAQARPRPAKDARSAHAARSVHDSAQGSPLSVRFGEHQRRLAAPCQSIGREPHGSQRRPRAHDQRSAPP